MLEISKFKAKYNIFISSTSWGGGGAGPRGGGGAVEGEAGKNDKVFIFKWASE